MSNSALGTKDRPYQAKLSLNNEDAAALAIGQPVMFSAGFDGVQLPSSGVAATAPTFFAGVVTKATPVGEVAPIICGGYAPSCKFVVRTRAGTTGTDVWASVASIPAGNYCTIDTTNNAFASSGVGAALASPYLAVIPSSVASIASVATSTSDTLTVSTALRPLFIRNLF